MRIVLAVAFVALAIPGWGKGTSVKEVIGSWEGESKCTVPDSPCHDEHVLLQVVQDKSDPWQLKVDAYKVVDGAPDFMGTLTCRFQSGVSAMSCTGNTSQKDDWEFQISGETMTGRLTIGAEKTLYRRLKVQKTAGKAK